MAIYEIPIDAEVESEIHMDVRPSLKWLQGYVGGPIQMLETLYKSFPAQIICHEEGRIKNMVVNYVATTIYRDYWRLAGETFVVQDIYLFGPCIILTDRHCLV